MRPTVRTVVTVVAAVCQLVIGVVPYAASTAVTPPAVAVGLYTLWVAATIMLIAAARRGRIWQVAAIPAVTLLVWVAIVQSGAWLFGWTA